MGNDTGAATEMPRYVSHKTVHALEIESVSGPGGLRRNVFFTDERFVPALLSEDMFTRYMPVKGDFLVFYADGYKSFSPRKAFIDGYTRA